VQVLLNSLAELLLDYDTDAADILDELIPMIANQAHLSLLKQAQRALDDYDFDKAVEMVEQFQQELTDSA
jgi:hypothetical protein